MRVLLTQICERMLYVVLSHLFADHIGISTVRRTGGHWVEVTHYLPSSEIWGRFHEASFRKRSP